MNPISQYCSILLIWLIKSNYRWGHLAWQTGPAGIFVKRKGGVFWSPGKPHHRQNPTFTLDRPIGLYLLRWFKVYPLDILDNWMPYNWINSFLIRKGVLSAISARTVRTDRPYGPSVRTVRTDESRTWPKCKRGITGVPFGRTELSIRLWTSKSGAL